MKCFWSYCFDLEKFKHFKNQKDCLLSSNFLGSPAEFGAVSFLTSLGSLSYIIMQVMLSVPVPSDKVISPLAIPWSIISSIMKEVSPGGFLGFNGSDFYFLVLSEFLLAFGFIVCIFLGALGPFSLLLRTNLAAYSFVKQSQIPSQATIMKSWSGLIGTFFTSG